MITYAEARSRISTRNEAESVVLFDAVRRLRVRNVSRGNLSGRLRRKAMRDEFNSVLAETWANNRPVGNPVAVWLFWWVVRSIVWQVVLLMWGELDSKKEGV